MSDPWFCPSRVRVLAMLGAAAGILLATCAPAQPVPRSEAGSSSAARPAAGPGAASLSGQEPGSRQPPPLQKVNLMGVAITYAQIAMPVAKEAGFFEEQGLDAEVIFGSRAPTALLAGEVQFAGGAVDDVIVANLSGGNLAVIGSMVSTLQHKFLARPEIQSGADLRGKPVGVSKRGSLTHTVARMAAKRGGLDPERDVTIIELGDTAAQLAAMANGAIYGTALVPPSIEVAERNGAHVLYDFPAEKIEYTVASLATSRDWAASNERAVLGVLRALAQPVQLNHTRPEYVADVYAQWTKSDRAAGQTAVALARDVVPLKMLPTARGIQQVLDAVSEQVPVAATASPTDFFDDSYVKRLEAEGFYDHLGAS